MYLMKIWGRNVKGGDFSFDLTRANVLIGDNFKGKTRVADAVRLVYLGYLPELGKQPRSTFKLSAGAEMEVGGTFNNGEEISRRWFLKGETVKTEDSLPPGFDAVSAILATMLNADVYFGLSDRDRVTYVFENCRLAKVFARDEITARIAKVAPGYEFAPFWQDVDATEGVTLTPQLEIELLVGFVAEEWRSLKEQAKRMEETTRGLSNLRALDAQTRPVSAIDDDRVRVERALAELNERKGAVAAAYGEQARAQQRRQEIAREINATDKDAHAKVELDNRLDMILRELAAFPPEANVRALFDVMTNAQRDYDVARLPAGELRRQVDEVEEEIHQIDGMTECPTCGACGEGWKKGRLAELVQKHAALAQRLAAATNLVVERDEAREKAKKEHDDASASETRRAQFKVEEARSRDALSKLDARLARRTALEEERDRLPDYDMKVEERMQAVQGEINVLQQESRALENERSAAIGRQHDLKRLADAETARDRAKGDQELAAAAGKELRQIQSELVEAAFGPLLERANRIFAGVMLTPLAYRDGEIGTWRSGVWVSHETFSGVEKALTYAAIQAALAAESPYRVMIVDELGRLRHDNAELAAVAVLNALERGDVEQFIGIDPERPGLYRTLPKVGELSFNVIEIS